MSKDTTAKVAQIVSQFEVAFNRGADAGISKGDIATVMRSVEVKDPESQTSLGTVQRPAIRLQITEVHAKFCVGQTFEQAPTPEDEIVFTLSKRSGRQRVTGRAVNTDWRTVFVAPGQEVSILRPPAETKQEAG